VTGRDSTGRYGLHLVDTENAKVKSVAPTAGGGLEVGAIRWAPDGGSLIFASSSRLSPGFYQVDLGTGNASQLVPYPPGQWLMMNGKYSPDGRRFYCVRIPQNADAVRERDLSTGVETTLKIEMERPFLAGGLLTDGQHLLITGTEPVVMPGGQRVLINGKAPDSRVFVLRLLSLAGGESRDLLRLPQAFESRVPTFLRPLTLVSDGSAVLVAMSTGEPTETGLWLVPMLGGEPRKIGSLERDKVSEISVSSDGRQLAYVIEEGDDPGGTEEVRVLENFVPKAATK
jgi:dipeptidyl aminopeptidase/acylaminoacyl peptidase